MHQSLLKETDSKIVEGVERGIAKSKAAHPFGVHLPSVKQATISGGRMMRSS
jgi:hypothetical protein